MRSGHVLRKTPRVPTRDVSPRPAGTGDRSAMVAVLAEAFADDAALAAALPTQVRHRDARLRRFFAQEVTRSIRRGGAWTTADGAAVWYPPGHWEPRTPEALRQIPASLWVFREHTGRAARIAATLRGHHPREPHWYLAYVGTRRERQSTGIGAALLRPVLERCDREGLPAYLEASSERSRRLYLKLGFIDRGEPLPVVDGGPAVLPMWRPPA